MRRTNTKYKATTEVMNRLRSVSEHAVNLNVQREMCLRRLFVCNNGTNGKTLRKWSFFCEAPMCHRLGRNARCRGNCYSNYIPKTAVLLLLCLYISLG